MLEFGMFICVRQLRNVVQCMRLLLLQTDLSGGLRDS